MEDTNKERGEVRCVYVPADLVKRLDALSSQGVVTSSLVAISLRATLSGIEKKLESGKQIPGLRIRKER